MGSTSTVVDAGGNNPKNTMYYSFGGIRLNTGAGLTDKLYTGQALDISTGLYYYGARYYDPYLNRWISPDSIVPQPGNPQALNRYSYALNNPIRYVDPTGHYTEDELNEHLGEDWERVYFDDTYGVFGKREKFVEFLRSKNTTDLVTLSAIGESFRGAARLTGQPDAANLLQRADGIVLQGGLSIGFAAGGGASITPIGVSFVSNLSSGEVSWFYSPSFQLEAGAKAMGAVGSSFGIIANMSTNDNYGGLSAGFSGLLFSGVGASVSGSFSAPFGLEGPATSTLNGGYMAGAGYGASAGVGLSYGLEVYRDTSAGRSEVLPQHAQGLRESGEASFQRARMGLDPTW